jgi:hypothetical protein
MTKAKICGKMDEGSKTMEVIIMTRARAKELQKKYGMEIMRHYITRQGFGLYVQSENRIPELDELAADRTTPILANHVEEPYLTTYELYCPTSWFDLWGWADE